MRVLVPTIYKGFEWPYIVVIMLGIINYMYNISAGLEVVIAVVD